MKANKELNDAVLSQRISANRLCTMSPDEMAVDRLKQERQRIEQYHLEAAKLRNLNQLPATGVKCPQCSSRNVTYYEWEKRYYIVTITFALIQFLIALQF